MKIREVIGINRSMNLQELCGFMQQKWDKESYNDFVVGRPAAGAFQDYIMLPATTRCVVCVYPRKGKVILAVMTNSGGQMTLAGSLVLGGYGRMGMVGEMQGVASQRSLRPIPCCGYTVFSPRHTPAVLLGRLRYGCRLLWLSSTLSAIICRLWHNRTIFKRINCFCYRG